MRWVKGEAFFGIASGNGKKMMMRPSVRLITYRRK